MLVDHSDAQRVGVSGGLDRDLTAVLENLSAFGLVDAGEHVHQGGFAAAVLTKKTEDFASVDSEVDLVVCDYRTERLPDVPQFNGTIGFHFSILYSRPETVRPQIPFRMITW